MKLKSRFQWTLPLAISIMALGAFLRLVPFLRFRSLWCDEAKLAVNVLDRSFLELLQPLDHGQLAPVGFLFLTKGLVALLGGGERVLRFIPLVAGVAGLPLFWSVVYRRVPAIAAVAALGLFAVNGDSIYYASAFKQYSLDTAMALGMTAILLWWGERGHDRSSTAWVGVAAVTSPWFSLPSALVVGPGIAWHWVMARKGGEATSIGRVSLVMASWLTSIFLLILVVLLPTLGSSFFDEYWRPGFLPLTSVEGAFAWILQSPGRIMHWPLGFHSHGIALFLIATGIVWLVLNRRRLAPFLLGPILMAFLAGVFHLYPFGGSGGRTILFLVPYLILLLAIPLGWAAGNKGGSRWVPVLVTALLVILLGQPLKDLAGQLRDGTQREELWPILSGVQNLLEPDDTVYLYYGARSPLLYYRRQLDPFSGRVVNGSSPGSGEDLPADLGSLSGLGRVWVVASWGCRGSEAEVDAVTTHLGQRGRILKELREPGAVAVLFDLGS